MKLIYILSFLLYTIPVFATPVTPDAALNRLQSQNMSKGARTAPNTALQDF